MKLFEELSDGRCNRIRYRCCTGAFIKSIYIIIAGVIFILFFMDHIAVNFISRFRFKPLTALILVSVLVAMIFAEKLLLEKCLSITSEHEFLRGIFYKNMENVRYLFNAILGAGFLILYFRYTRKTFSPSK